jgi:hypothetical protein
MIKLIKTKPAGWNGNGFGNHSAEYEVDRFEHIVVKNKGGTDWCAYDTDRNKYVVRPYGWTKKQVVEQLEDILIWKWDDRISLND